MDQQLTVQQIKDALAAAQTAVGRTLLVRFYFIALARLCPAFLQQQLRLRHRAACEACRVTLALFCCL